ncbi:MAG: GAF domain-containing protein [Melioribacteraceae bacterium]|nr:GAF domain-containing protein [Melioribacteraceae bacterium]MCF8353454.1 GAF domain-containing protein [Melioribacteraceae bacterium]MCF8393942.1 GAF domain-containing protein [Melioribacteraceae bacterium]MCF8419015.1 GAF domain-containing protein [Melioribacteraceae bacterium]
MSKAPDILIFSDGNGTSAIYESFVSMGNYYVHFAQKDDSGLNKLNAHEFDLILVEISQPLMSEILFIERIRLINAYVPVVIVSEYFRETKNSVFGNKISQFIDKPLTLDKLYSTIQDTLNPDAESKKYLSSEEAAISDKKLLVLYEFSKRLNSINDFDQLLMSIIELATDALKADRATVFVLDKKKNELWSRVGTGIERKEIRFPKTTGIAGQVVCSGTSLIIDDPYSSPLFNREVDIKTGYKTESLLCVPMRNLSGEIVGAFQVLNKENGKFSTDDEMFLSAMAANVAIALENTLLHDDLKSKYEETQRLYDDLYTAQKMIVWDTKHSTISEIQGMINEIKQYDAVPTQVKKLIEANGKDNEVADKLMKLRANNDNMFKRINARLTEMLKELETAS